MTKSTNLTKALTRCETSEQTHMDGQKDRDNYDHHEQSGILSVMTRLARETPELTGAYLFVLAGCLLAGKYWLH